MATVETATYGAEYVSARTCVEQLVDLRNTLRYLGVPLRERSYMFGDNESVVNSSVQPHAKLHKRHNALSFHRVREAIASGVFVFLHIPGENNPADILSKHWGYTSIWHMLKAIMYVEGDTIDSPGRSGRDTKSGKDLKKATIGYPSGSGSISVSAGKVPSYIRDVGISTCKFAHGTQPNMCNTNELRGHPIGGTHSLSDIIVDATDALASQPPIKWRRYISDAEGGSLDRDPDSNRIEIMIPTKGS
jgi:hypothetical protein